MIQLETERPRDHDPLAPHRPPITEFDHTTGLEPDPDRPGSFGVELSDAWSSLVGVHGGYLCAIAVRGAETVVPDRLVRTLTTSFLRTGRTGPATLQVRELRHGRSVSTVVADLSQAGELVTTTRLTLVDHRRGVEWAHSVPLALPTPDACVPIEPPDGVAHLHRVDALLDPAGLPFTAGDRAHIRGYLRPLEHRPVDGAWLAMAADWFPPPAFVRIDPPTGGVSIDLTTHIHRPRFRLADGQWLTGSFEVVTSTGGLAVEHGRIAERDGTLIAESFQTRWTAQ